ncbi:hypothetical protein SAMN04490244_102236 [Tranquillimonas rosea]|uniref:Uncharacterized protein n=1 Tax=Tranquillimonas rosea TaxID=641238 RepID=A0A1H9RE26_9RHOB|nr:hypothetical protein [Tranquillimonas rosea]SER71020.1 hypothetical protein SAMN04490244_102236 [Tranquillimonas rosea]
MSDLMAKARANRTRALATRAARQEGRVESLNDRNIFAGKWTESAMVFTSERARKAS